MIYLIGWTPRCGKTTLAKLLSQRLWISYIQTDYIASAIQSKRSENEEKIIFWDKWFDDANRINNDIRFSVFNNQEQIEHYNLNAKWNRPWIKNIIDYALADQEDIIIEWYHLWPNIILDDLIKRWDKVSYIILYKSNIHEIEQWIKNSLHINDRAIKNTFQEGTYSKIASFIYEFGQKFKENASVNNIPTYDMSNGDFQKNINHIIEDLIH